MTPGNILLIFLLVALNGFFVGVEFAAVASRRTRLELLTESNSHAAQLVRAWLEQPSARERLIAASQLGITLVSLALGAVGENTFEALLEPYFHQLRLPASFSFLQSLLPALPLLISLLVVTSLHVVLGEQVPKVAVLRAPERFALAAAPYMQAFSKVFKSFVDLLDWSTRQVLVLIGLPASSAHSTMYSLEEFKQMVTGPEAEAIIRQPEREMLSAVIDFGELVVRQVSIPRTEITAAPADAPASEALRLCVEKGITKLPVYEGNLDQIIGIVHLRDLIPTLQNPENSGRPLRELAREALFVPETISVNDLLHQFRARHTHIAIVLDEFGGTAGLVTLEDLLEEIIGEVQGPFDAGPPPIQPMPDGSALIAGMTFIEEINEYFGLQISSPYYDTIAGYILDKLGRIPQVGDVVEDEENHIRLKVMRMDRLRIDLVSLSRL